MNYSISQLIAVFAVLFQVSLALPFRNLAVRDLAPVNLMRREYFNTTTLASASVAAVSTSVSLIPTTDATGGVYTIYSTVTITIDPTTSAEASSEEETTTYTTTQFFYVTVNDEGSSSTVETTVAETVAPVATAAASSSEQFGITLANNLREVDPESLVSSTPAPSSFYSAAPATVTVTVTENNCPASSTDPSDTTTYIVTRAMTYTVPFSSDVSVTDAAGSLVTVIPASTDLTTTYYDYQTITTVLGSAGIDAASIYSSVPLTAASTRFDFSNNTIATTAAAADAAAVAPSSTAAVAAGSLLNYTNSTLDDAALAKRWLKLF